jgi:hypothetical protein
MSPPPLAAFGTTPMDKGIARKSESKPEKSKYKDFLDAIHSAAFSDKNIDEQTRLEWDNIEGEVMGCVLTEDLISGTMFSQIEDPIFTYETPHAILNDMFVEAFVETLNKHRHLVPSVTVMKQKLNELMISWKGLGREELIRMLQSFQISMQESEKNDQLQKMFGR